ncbi:MAG: uracil phosphoribosyltransferase [Promethearchaeota archaeon]
MTIYNFSNKKAIQILATQSRRVDITPWELSCVHQEMGKFMAYQIIEEVDLEDCEINHPQGKKLGKCIKDEENIIILSFIRAGVYVSNGIRFVFQRSPTYYITSDRVHGFNKKELGKLPKLKNKTIILVDSVINTGETIIPVIQQIQSMYPKKIIITCLVIFHETVEKLESLFPNVKFYYARSSTNFYVGKGTIDTGNRLFGTFHKISGGDLI